MRGASRYRTRKVCDRSVGTRLLGLRRILRLISHRRLVALYFFWFGPAELSAARYLVRRAFHGEEEKALVRAGFVEVVETRLRREFSFREALDLARDVFLSQFP